MKFPAALSLFDRILLRHGMTSATIDMTFASGPVAAATSGIAVEATHHDCGSSSSGGLILKWARIHFHGDSPLDLLCVDAVDPCCIVLLA